MTHPAPESALLDVPPLIDLQDYAARLLEHAQEDSAETRLAREKIFGKLLRVGVHFPLPLMGILYDFVETMQDATRDIRFGAAQEWHYGPEDKLPLIQEVLGKTYRHFGENGEYPLPRISFAALEKSAFPDENGVTLPSRTLGEIHFPGPEIVLNEDLKKGDLETLFSVTVHECLHGLVTGFQRGCYGVKKNFLNNPGMQWTQMNPAVQRRFYFACPEEALVRAVSSHAVFRLTPDIAAAFHCEAVQMTGYRGHLAAQFFEAYVRDREKGQGEGALVLA